MLVEIRAFVDYEGRKSMVRLYKGPTWVDGNILFVDLHGVYLVCTFTKTHLRYGHFVVFKICLRKTSNNKTNKLATLSHFTNEETETLRI